MKIIDFFAFFYLNLDKRLFVNAPQDIFHKFARLLFVHFFVTLRGIISLFDTQARSVKLFFE